MRNCCLGKYDGSLRALELIFSTFRTISYTYSLLTILPSMCLFLDVVSMTTEVFVSLICSLSEIVLVSIWWYFLLKAGTHTSILTFTFTCVTEEFRLIWALFHQSLIANEEKSPPLPANGHLCERSETLIRSWS